MFGFAYIIYIGLYTYFKYIIFHADTHSMHLLYHCKLGSGQVVMSADVQITLSVKNSWVYW